MNLVDALAELDGRIVARFGIAVATAVLPFYQELLPDDLTPERALSVVVALLGVPGADMVERLDEAERELGLAMERLSEPSKLSARDVTIADNVLAAVSWACATVRAAHRSPDHDQFDAANAAMVAALRSQLAAATWAGRPYLPSTDVHELAYQSARLHCQREQLLVLLGLLPLVPDLDTAEIVVALFDETPGPLSDLVLAAGACRRTC
jgi:hypothetical protein